MTIVVFLVGANFSDIGYLYVYGDILKHIKVFGGILRKMKVYKGIYIYI